MAQPQHTPSLDCLEGAVTVLFCLIDDAYALLNPRARRYESLKQLSDSEIIALALLQQLRGVESEHSFLREAQRFFSHLVPERYPLRLVRALHLQRSRLPGSAGERRHRAVRRQHGFGPQQLLQEAVP